MNADGTSPEKLKDLFEAAGLTDVATRPIEISVTFRDVDDYWNSNTGFASPVATLVKRLTEDKRRQLIQLLKTKLPINEQGVILYSAGVNAVKGTPEIITRLSGFDNFSKVILQTLHCARKWSEEEKQGLA